MGDRRYLAVGITYELLRDVLDAGDGFQVSRVYDDFDRLMLKVLLKPTKGTPSWALADVVPEGGIVPLTAVEVDGRCVLSIKLRWWLWLKVVSWYNSLVEKYRR